MVHAVVPPHVTVLLVPVSRSQVLGQWVQVGAISIGECASTLGASWCARSEGACPARGAEHKTTRASCDAHEALGRRGVTDQPVTFRFTTPSIGAPL